MPSMGWGYSHPSNLGTCRRSFLLPTTNVSSDATQFPHQCGLHLGRTITPPYSVRCHRENGHGGDVAQKMPFQVIVVLASKKREPSTVTGGCFEIENDTCSELNIGFWCRATAVTSEGAKREIAHARPFPADTPQPRFPYAGAWTKGLAKVLSGSCFGRKGQTSTWFITGLTSV